jgi:hypothetical protein
MGEVAIGDLAARTASYSPFVRHVKYLNSLFIRLLLPARSGNSFAALG